MSVLMSNAISACALTKSHVGRHHAVQRMTSVFMSAEMPTKQCLSFPEDGRPWSHMLASGYALVHLTTARHVRVSSTGQRSVMQQTWQRCIRICRSQHAMIRWGWVRSKAGSAVSGALTPDVSQHQPIDQLTAAAAGLPPDNLNIPSHPTSNHCSNSSTGLQSTDGLVNIHDCQRETSRTPWHDAHRGGGRTAWNVL